MTTDSRSLLNLFNAIEDNDLASIQALLNAGNNPNMINKFFDWPPLYAAVKGGSDPNIVKALLSAGANPNVIIGKNLLRIIHIPACHDDMLATLRVLLDAGANPNVLSSDGWNWTALHYATERNRNPGAVQPLLDAGADPNIKTLHSKSTPLHFAAMSDGRNLDVIKALLNAGANPRAKNVKKYTPLHLAAAWNANPEVIQVFLDAGANPKLRDKYGRRPIKVALEHDQPRNQLRVLRNATKRRFSSSLKR